MTNFDAVFDFLFNLAFSLDLNFQEHQKKVLENSFPKIGPKGLNPIIGENKEMHKKNAIKNIE